MNRNPDRRSFRLMLAAAVVAPAMLLLTASNVRAQYPVHQDGAANDANNRIGSNGRNTGGSTSVNAGTTVTGNQIVFGNVTNGKAFRGPVGTTDARAFRGNTGSITSDRFIRDSTGGYDNRSYTQDFQSRPYYGESRGVAPPAGYVPPVSITGNAYTQSPQFAQPLNAASLATLQTGEGLMPRIGTTTTVLGGPTDPRTGLSGSYMLMSPLSGIKQVTPDQVSGYLLPSSQLPLGPGNTGDRFRTGSQFIDRVRSEMGPDSNNPTPGAPGTNNGNQGATDQNGNPAPIPGGPQPLNKPLSAPEGPTNRPLGQQTATPSVGQQPLTNGLNSGESIRRSYTIPTKPNEVMNELDRRLRDVEGQPTTDQQAAQDFRNQVPVIPGTGMPATRPGTPIQSLPTPGMQTTPAPTTPGGAAPQGRVEPLNVDTFSKGVASPTLAGMLKNAEQDMKAGKYNDAIEKYTLAEQAAPNDALISVGHANADLGASNYRSAETRLRQAFGTRPALLMAKYDLNAMIGQERLSAITRDLTELSKKEPQETMAPFLLAYIDYNTGNPAEAVNQLNEVAKREGQADGVVKSMLQRWGGPATNQNK